MKGVFKFLSKSGSEGLWTRAFGWRSIAAPTTKESLSETAQQLYQQKLLSLFAKQGITPSEIEWTILPKLSEETVGLDIMAKVRGKLLAGVSREFGKDWIELTQIEVGQSFKSTGLGRSIYESERSIFKELGYSGSTVVKSPVVSPVTARWQYQLYGSRADELSIEANFPGVSVKEFYEKLLSKRLSKQEFPMMYMTGTLSGKDDAWNTISGFAEKGLAKLMREDFGSGWRGLLAVPKSLSKVFQKAFRDVKGANILVEGARLGSRNVDELVERMRLNIFESLGSEKNKLRAFSVLDNFEKKLRETPFKSIAVLDPTAIAKQAEIEGIPAFRRMKSVIRHERFHQFIEEAGLSGYVARMPLDMTEWLKTKRGQVYKSFYDKSPYKLNRLKEEYLAAGLEARETLHGGTASFTQKGTREAYSKMALYKENTDALDMFSSVNMMKLRKPEEAEVVSRTYKAAFRKRWYTAHRQAQIDISRNVTGGRNHLRAGNR